MAHDRKRILKNNINGHELNSLVFVDVETWKDRLVNINLTSVHVDELKAKDKPRVIDKIRFGFGSRSFNKNAADQIVGFLNLQAPPVCLLIEDDKPQRQTTNQRSRGNKKIQPAVTKLDQLETLKQNLEKWNQNVLQDVWYSYFTFYEDRIDSKQDKHSNSSSSNSRKKVRDNVSALNSFAQHPIESLGALKPLQFSSFTANPFGFSPKMARVGSGAQRDSNETFVFLNVEATCKDTKRITEISMMALSKKQLLDSWFGPEDCDMLTLVVDPGCEISEHDCKVTKLTRSSITRSSKRSFDEDVAAAVCQFLKRYPDPVCLVSHGGRDFDFGVLRKHLKRFPHVTWDLESLKSLDAFVGFMHVNGMTEGLSLPALYARCFGSSPANGHIAEGLLLALVKVVNIYPSVLRKAPMENFFQTFC